MRKSTAYCIFNRFSSEWLSETGAITRNFTKAKLFDQRNVSLGVEAMLELGHKREQLTVQTVEATWVIIERKPA